MYLKILLTLICSAPAVGVAIPLSASNLSQLCNCDPATATSINLSNKSIESIEANALTAAVKLTSLDLSGNMIGSLASTTFYNSPTLLSLNLSRNSLTSIPALVFSRLNRLARLDLSNNKIIAVDKMTTMGLVDLQVINLLGNPISKVQPGFVRQLCLTNPKCSVVVTAEDLPQ